MASSDNFSDVGSFLESDTEPGNVRYDATRECSGLCIYLPNRVSGWNRFHVENALHIYYENFSSDLPDVLEKITQIKQLGHKQKQHIDILKSSHFGPDLNLREVYYNNRKTKQLLKEALVEEKSSFRLGDSTLSSLSPSNRSFIHFWICDYISTLEGFLDTVFKKEQFNNAEKEKDSLFKTTPFVCEEAYSKIISAFVAMCGLQVEKGNADNQNVWKHLRGMDKMITSKPDFRFHCTGEDFSDRKNLLTVTEVKKKAQKKDKERLMWKPHKHTEKRAKRIYNTVSPSSTSSSSSIESDEHLYKSEKGFPLTQRSVRPLIELHVGTDTLGQHAGDLLLDLHTYMEQNSDVTSERPSVLIMPGIIFDKTMVYLTLLQMSYEHYKKISGPEQLTSEDRATIYYSAPYNIFDKEDSFTLIDTFVNLNNIQQL